MLSVSETTCLLLAIRFVLAFLLAADKVLQGYAQKPRAPALNFAQDDRCIFEITSNKSVSRSSQDLILFFLFLGEIKEMSPTHYRAHCYLLIKPIGCNRYWKGSLLNLKLL